MKYILVIALMIFAGSAAAFENLLPEPEEKRAKQIFAQVKCMVCEGESIRDSNAQLALSQREAIREQIRNGKSDEEIFQFIKERYGPQAITKPEVDDSTYLLWFAPLVLLLLGTGYVIRLVRSNNAR